MQEFSSSDALAFHDIVEGVVSRIDRAIAFEEGIRKSAIVQSMILDNGILRFAVEIQESLKFTAYHKGVLCTVTTLSRINTGKITCWSSLEEAVRFLKNVDDTKHQKKNVIHEHLHVVGLPDGDDNSLFRVLCYFKSSLLSSMQRLPIALRKNSNADNIEV